MIQGLLILLGVIMLTENPYNGILFNYKKESTDTVYNIC